MRIKVEAHTLQIAFSFIYFLRGPNICRRAQKANMLFAPGSHLCPLVSFSMRCAWLFDATINAYMWLLQQRDHALCAADPARLPTYFFNSFFFEKMFENNGVYSYSSVKSWSEKVRRATF